MTTMHSIGAMALLSLTLSTGLAAQANKPISTSPDDTVQLRVVYHDTQRATKEGEPYLMTDTMTLAIGARLSAYYDWREKERSSARDAQLDKIRSIRVMTEAPQNLSERLEHQQDKLVIADPMVGESMKIYRWQDTGKQIIYDKAPSGMMPQKQINYYLVEQAIPEWTISSDTTSILGYACQRAETTVGGRKYTAWFTLDIPMSEGPWKLYGLPGLILRAQDSEGLFTFEAVGLWRPSGETIVLPNQEDDDIVIAKSMKEIQTYRRRRFARVTYFLDQGGGNYDLMPGKNNVTYSERELIP